MARYVLDARAAIELASEDVVIPAEHELLAPTLIRSQVLSLLHETVHAGAMTEAEAERRRARVDGWRMRLLGDAVLRRVAWKLAGRLGWATTFDAEYVALTQLQADALITGDQNLARAVHGIVDIATLDVLR
jgi:indolepyruvate ferredoxin oxidoreductase alpha subunit